MKVKYVAAFFCPVRTHGLLTCNFLGVKMSDLIKSRNFPIHTFHVKVSTQANSHCAHYYYFVLLFSFLLFFFILFLCEKLYCSYTQSVGKIQENKFVFLFATIYFFLQKIKFSLCTCYIFWGFWAKNKENDAHLLCRVSQVKERKVRMENKYNICTYCIYLYR